MIHLHRHSEYSFPDGTGTAEQYAKRAKELGQYALALTDHGTLSGIPHHMKACNKEGIFPICGVEAYFRENRLWQHKDNKKAYHLILHAKNATGWKNLMRLTSEAYRSGFYGKPCVDYELLEKYHEGLTVTSACIGSYSSQMILQGNDTELDAYLQFMLETFGDDFYIALQPHDFDDQRTVNVALLTYAWSLSIPIVIEVDAHYVTKDLRETQDVVQMIKTNQTLEKRAKKIEEGKDVYQQTVDSLYIMDDREVLDLFADAHPDIPEHVIKEAIKQTETMVSKFVPWTLDRTSKKPRIVSSQDEAFTIVKDWCDEGLERVGKQDDEIYKERLEYELNILRQKEVLDYFVLVGRMVRWAKSNGIRVGIGRGSAAGSLVSYLIGITGIDPIAYGLLFERFLNPARKAMPDIDIDFQADRREEVKDYLRREYGKDHVADIITHQTFKPRAALKDVGRVLNLPYVDSNNATSDIAITFPDPLEKYRKTSEAVAYFAEKYPEAWQHALNIENQIRNVGKHAAGVVITDKPVNDYLPTQRSKDGEIVTSWDDRASYMIIKELGLMKLDILGLTDLEIEGRACEIIERQTGITIELEKLGATFDPYDVDPQTMRLFKEGLTLGLFQFNTAPMTRLLKDMQPESILDLAAANALFRPGAKESIPDFIKRGQGESFEYWHPSVEPILKETHGIVTFQEQVMKISQGLGGFTGGEADDFRKAIGNLYREGIEAVHSFMAENGYDTKFISNAKQKVGEEAAKEIWDKLIAFGGYGFNKSHSCGYSLQAYYGAWLKAHYPIAFYCAMLTHDPALAPKAAREAKSLGVTIKGPDINESKLGFTVDGDQIRFGLLAIKQVGDVAAREISANAPFVSYDDLVERTTTRSVNKKVLDALIGSGALDRFGMRDHMTALEKSVAEKDTLGIAISGTHEAMKYDAILNERVWSERDLEEAPEKTEVIVGGEITNVKAIKTKNGHDMGFVDIAFRDNEYSCTVFPGIWHSTKDTLNTATTVIVKAKTSKRGLIADKILNLETVDLNGRPT